MRAAASAAFPDAAGACWWLLGLLRAADDGRVSTWVWAAAGCAVRMLPARLSVTLLMPKASAIAATHAFEVKAWLDSNWVM
jgi:hypothetical protein